MFRRLKPEKSGARSIDGMKSPRVTTPEQAAEVLDAQALPWKSEPEVKTDQRSENDKLASKRRRNRIIGFFCIEEKATVTPEEIVKSNSRGLRELQRERANELRQAIMRSAEPQVTPEKHQLVLKKLAKGEITPEDEANFLLLIEGPLTKVGAEKMFEQLAKDPRQTQILAVAAGLNVSNWQKVDATEMKKMLTALQTDGDDYRTPVGFKNLERYFLKGIRPRAKAQVYEQYVRSMRELERTLYGERVDYAEEFERLRKEAGEQKEGATDPAVMVAQPKKKLVTLSAGQSGEMLGRSVIMGDPWLGNGKEVYLSTHHLAEAKLGPTYEIEVGTAKVCVSEIFQVGSGEVAAMAYVPQGKESKVRTFYRGAGQSLWRYLPDYTRRNDGRINRYLTGFSVESVTLPIALQEALVRIEKKAGVRTMMSRGYQADFLVAGTAQAYDSLQDYQAAWHYGRLKGDYYTEVSSEPSNHDFDLNDTKQKKAPYTLAIDYGRAPDFGAKMAEFELVTADAGVARAEGFMSHDGQYAWLFARDRMGRAWIEQVEVLSPLTGVGLRRDWVAMGDFTTKLYEHTNRAGIYGDREDMKGARQCMWKNYLSNIPLIQEYTRR